MRSTPIPSAAALVLAACLAAPAGAIVSPGQPVPDFTKNQLDHPAVGQVTPRSLADWSGKVIVFFLLGFA